MAAKKSEKVENSLKDMSISSKGGQIRPGGGKKSGDEKDSQVISYSADKVIGNGSFGVVFKATKVDTGETVAIKKVLQDKRFMNRELQIMRILSHPCVVPLKHCFYSSGDKPDEQYLNLVLEFVPDTVYKICRQYAKQKSTLSIADVKVYSYQLLRSLAYIHSLGICHRDIKPQNLLVNPETHELKLCDFGSAKQLVKSEPNVSYICSRYYRAPELIFGNSNYSTWIDVWSVGCVIAELMMGQPIFPGESGVDQLVEIIKLLGTPSKESIQEMNPDYKEYKFPMIRPLPWEKVFRHRTPREAIDFVARLLQYDPKARPTPLSSLLDPYFDELRDQNTRLPNGGALPDLFNFTQDEHNMEPQTVAGCI